MVTWRSDLSVTYRFESSSAAQNSSVSRDSSVGVDRLLEADSVETFWRRSFVTRATKESKDVEVPRLFKNRVASVSPSVEGDRRSVHSAGQVDLSSSTSTRTTKVDEELKRRWHAVRRHIWLRQESTDFWRLGGRTSPGGNVTSSWLIVRCNVDVL